ncbi:MAG: hypothetical protein RLZZ220_476 [Pseudomonadota bacterium]|jgi:hypothetical protein|nr:hypothetical protein [Zoogloea sp.]
MIVSVMLEDHGQCLAAGLSDHLGTPVGLDQLLARLREWIVGGRNPAPGGDWPQGCVQHLNACRADRIKAIVINR